MNGKGSILRKGIAAFLMLILVGSSIAFAGGTTVYAEEAAADENEAATETAAVENAPVIEEAATAEDTAAIDKPEAEGSEGISSEVAVEELGNVNVEGKEDDLGVVLFAQDDSEGSIDADAAESTAVTGTPQVPQNQSFKFNYTERLYYENCSTHDFTVTCNGGTTTAYCIEPSQRRPAKTTFTANAYNNVLMKKALYYSFGYPGYSQKTAGYLAGVSRKACYSGDKGAYCLCHIVLSYVYDNKSSKGDAFKGVSSSTKTVVKNFLAAIESWPDPPSSADIGLSASSVKAEWKEDAMRQETPEITVTGTPGNSISVPVPEGASIVKGDTSANSGSVNVAVGESFSLTAPPTVHDDYHSPSLPGSIELFQPYLLSPTGKQNQMFGLSFSGAVSYNVDWKEFGTVNLKKISSEENVTSGNTYYSLEGAEYGLYSRTTDKSYGSLVTDSEGNARLEDIPCGEYYVREKKASQGYKLDASNHEITVDSQDQSETVLEKPNKPYLETSAVEEESGSKSFYVKDDAAGEDTTIADTVTYKDLTPGLEYRITARLVDKATGDEIPSQVDEVVFTPDKSFGNLKIEYKIDSSGLGGKDAVAFEKMYYGGSLIALHEDINNKAQTVKILKPVDSAPDTGDDAIILYALAAIGVSLILGMCAVFRKFRHI